MADSYVPAWTVISQVEDYRQGSSGAFVPGVVITFRTAGGQTGSVFVPNDQYNPVSAKAAIAERAAAMDEVAGLTG